MSLTSILNRNYNILNNLFFFTNDYIDITFKRVRESTTYSVYPLIFGDYSYIIICMSLFFVFFSKYKIFVYCNFPLIIIRILK